MPFEGDDEDLSLSLRLDENDPPVDLTVGGLGDRILSTAVDQMVLCHRRQQSPAGVPWTPSRPATIQRKGHALVGYRTGRMLDSGRWWGAPREIEPRNCLWRHPYGDLRRGRAYGQAYAFHAGNPDHNQPARPLIDWTAFAQSEARRLIDAAARGEELPRWPG